MHREYVKKCINYPNEKANICDKKAKMRRLFAKSQDHVKKI